MTGRRDRVGLGELGLQLLLQIVRIRGRGEPVKVVGDVPGVPVVLVLVEGPVGAADEPGHASATEGLLPAPDVPLVLGRGQLARVGDAVGRHDAHADDRVAGLGFVLQIFLNARGQQLLGRVRALWARCATCSGLGLAGFQLVRQGEAPLVVFVLLAQPLDQVLALAFQP